MRMLLFLAVASFSGGLLTDGRHSARQARPEQPLISFVDVEAPPKTLRDMWSKAALVARVRVVDSAVTESKATVTFVITRHNVTVIEVLKGEGVKVGDTVRITIPTGTIPASGTTPMRSTKGPLGALSKGGEVVVFLEQWPASGGFGISFGPVGVYQVDTETVALPHDARKWFAGRDSVPKKAFLSEIRALASK